MDILNQPQPSSGQHYSGSNPVPDVQTFVDQLDSDKKTRDAAIDADNPPQPGESVELHAQRVRRLKHARVVHDPVTGHDVEIADADMDYKNAVDNPMVRTDILLSFSNPFGKRM